MFEYYGANKTRTYTLRPYPMSHSEKKKRSVPYMCVLCIYGVYTLTVTFIHLYINSHTNKDWRTAPPIYHPHHSPGQNAGIRSNQAWLESKHTRAVEKNGRMNEQASE